ncbi:hypothetical protein Cgig2_032865 [Carnegiea gigantea]|uniref:Reverse transcriptase n=1 Tax=Carnegiea gigantea TaxID=171969 RepID=A0A9Q1JIR7_9CARY|nr:hypothetical protein Cgig2_032865 [Carnegiea gigantea]
MAWRRKFQEGGVKHLVRHQSDHAPILISIQGFTPSVTGSKPFRFQAAWMLHSEFDALISQTWRTKTPMHIALDALAGQLSDWNKEIFGNLFRKKRKIWSHIEGIQHRLEEGGPRYLMKKVADYWQADTGWRWSDLVPLLPQEALNRIATIHLCSSMEINDQLFWGGTLSGSFTIQSAINILRGAEPPSNQGIWKTIWKVQAPQRMKALL